MSFVNVTAPASPAVTGAATATNMTTIPSRPPVSRPPRTRLIAIGVLRGKTCQKSLPCRKGEAGSPAAKRSTARRQGADSRAYWSCDVAKSGEPPRAATSAWNSSSVNSIVRVMLKNMSSIERLP